MKILISVCFFKQFLRNMKLKLPVKKSIFVLCEIRLEFNSNLIKLSLISDYLNCNFFFFFFFYKRSLNTMNDFMVVLWLLRSLSLNIFMWAPCWEQLCSSPPAFLEHVLTWNWTFCSFSVLTSSSLYQNLYSLNQFI